MEKDARLIAAKKKLKQFKKNKRLKKTKKIEDTEKPTQSKDEGELDIRKSEEFIDEKFELLHCSDVSSTESTTKNILQVSAKLTDIAAEADMVMDDTNTESSEETFETIDHPESYRCKISELERHNHELATNLASTCQENENLNNQCHQLLSKLNLLQLQIDEDMKNKTESQETVLHEQLQVQMQTIGVLVSEKQDMHQLVLDLQSKLEAGALQQTKSQETISSINDKLDFYERDLQSKIGALNEAEISNSTIRTEYVSLEQKLNEVTKLLSNEQIRSTEFSEKFMIQEEEIKKLRLSFLDAQEKLEMAEVLLSQIPSQTNSDSLSDMHQLRIDNEALATKLQGYQDAFEQLGFEREQFSIKYADAQKKWEYDLQQLQQKCVALEAENSSLLTQAHTPVSSMPSEDTEVLEHQESDGDCAVDSDLLMNELDEVKKELEESHEGNVVLQQEIRSHQNNIQHLSLLLQEKESRIDELQSELENVKSVANDHEHLLDVTRDDKSTISRALLQNNQLKEQLGEIQDGFVRLSNDKMELATKISSIEHNNKELKTCLDKYVDLYTQTKQDLDSKITMIETMKIEKENTVATQNFPSSNEGNENGKINAIETSENENANYIAYQSFPIANEESLLQPTLDQTHENNSKCDAREESDETMEVETIEQKPDEQHIETTKEENGPQNAMLLLKNKFTQVMKEKADLLNKLELLEHLNTQLQNECDTIGEYIALYHHQRQTLKQRHKDKDKYISTIIQEREAMQGKVEQLQTLIVAILNNTSTDGGNNIDFSSPVLPPDTLSNSELENEPFVTNELENSPDRLNHLATAQPDLVPKTDISLQYRNESQSPDFEKSSIVPFRKVQHSPKEEKSPAAEQILTLLQQMQKPIDYAKNEEKGRPGAFCMRYIGPYTAI